MVSMQAIFDEKLEDASSQILEKLVKKKLVDAGAKAKKGLVTEIVDAVNNGGLSTFDWDGGGNKDLTITFTEEDVADFERMASRFLDQLPSIVDSVSSATAKQLFKTLKKAWPNEYLYQEEGLLAFQAHLEKRWGKALGMLRMLLTISRELGSEIVRSHNDESVLESVLIRLHARACQVVAEIITLMENGYADGAMARWRTLHEISIVMILMREHGEPLAERYVAHRSIESKHAKDQYQQCSAWLGHEPISESESQEIEEAYEQAVQTYGKDFRGPYGWAEGYVTKNKSGRIALGDLEAAAGRAGMGAHYKFASNNVHAGPHALFSRLGLMDDSGLLAGASNAGLIEPGQNTAITFSLITVLLPGEKVDLDVLIKMRIVRLIQKEIIDALVKANNKLQRDHARHSQ